MKYTVKIHKKMAEDSTVTISKFSSLLLATIYFYWNWHFDFSFFGVHTYKSVLLLEQEDTITKVLRSKRTMR